MSKPIFKIVDDLPKTSLTTRLLGALDWVVPGEYKNTVGFENMIREVTGETDEKYIQKIGERAVALYNDKSEGYQTALWLYQTVDSTQGLAGAAALADKVGEDVSFMGWLRWLTPKADTTQTIDVSLKLITEVMAFCKLNGIPGDSIGDFVESLADYRHEALMRMAAIICMDGVVPLGPDFVAATMSSLKKMGPSEIEDNARYKKMEDEIPGSNVTQRLGFMTSSLDAMQNWVNSFVSSHNLNPSKIVGSLQGWAEGMDGKLDYVAAFTDMSTNYCEHTGTQSVARSLISRAAGEV